jgi:DNA-binding SARP family transcriptional activator
MKRIQTLGGLAVFDGSRPLGGNAQQPRRLAILAVLARAGERGVNRDRLATLLWGDVEEERARRSLNQALYALRQDLGSEEAILGTRELRLNPELVEVDLVTFETASASGALEEAARLYGGPFLGDFHLPGAREFARWAEEERARLEADYRGILQAVAAAAARRGDWGGAVLWWRRLAALDPTDSQAAQGLMRSLAAAGDVPGALRHAEIFAAVRQQDLELPPDPEVQALVDRIRQGGWSPEPARGPSSRNTTSADTPAGSESAATAPARPTRSRTNWIAGALAVVAVLGLAAGVSRWRSAARPALGPSVIAIAPFDVYDPTLMLWREGLMDLLARNLDGAGPLRTVPPTVVVRRWSGRADPPSAAELGRRTGAGLALYGSLLSSGPDSVRLRATLFDVMRGSAMDEWEVVDAVDRMDRLTDSLTVHVLMGLGRTREISAVRLARFGATRLPALKAFLQGEQYLRRSQWDSALAYYQRAIAVDSSFAPALYRASLTLGWAKRMHLAFPYAFRAAANNHGLPPRDSLLITANALFFSLMQGGYGEVDTAWTGWVRRLFATMEYATTRHPDDPEAWYEMGEALAHYGAFAGRSYEQQLEAFDRAIALDSGNAPSYIHPFQTSAMHGAEAMRRYLRPFLRVAPDDVKSAGGEGARLVERLLESAPGTALDTVLFQGVTGNGLFDAWESLSRLPDSAELAVSVARFIGSRARSADHGHGHYARGLLARTLISRGHLREAGGLLSGHQPDGSFVEYNSFTEAALFDVVPAEHAAAVFRRRLSGPAAPLLVAAFPWWASHKDTASLRLAEVQADSFGRGNLGVGLRRLARYTAASAAAYRALARADTSAALERFLALPDGVCPACILDRFTLAQLLTERRRYREAWRMLQGEFPGAPLAPFGTEVLWVLLRGRVAERLGEHDRAIRSYAWVAGMWRNADPELQPFVREARDGFGRLTREDE